MITIAELQERIECLEQDRAAYMGQHERDQLRIKSLEYKLKETGDALLRESKRTSEAKRQAQDECVQAILDGSQFFLCGIEPEKREFVVRRALGID